MDVFKLLEEREFNLENHVENILGIYDEGDVTVACWEPGQMSPYHAHHEAIEIYFCFEGGGTMRSEKGVVDITPGAFVVHPRGEYHEYTNGPERTLLFRVRYGANMKSTNLADRQAR